MEFDFSGKKLDAHGLGKCPCGAEIYYTLDPPAVLHALPYCQKFIDLDVDEFLRYVRHTRGITDN